MRIGALEFKDAVTQQYVNPGAAKVAGTVVRMPGSRQYGILMTDCAANASAGVAEALVRGRVILPKAAGFTLAVGDTPGWDDLNARVQQAKGQPIIVVTKAAASADTEVEGDLVQPRLAVVALKWDPGSDADEGVPMPAQGRVLGLTSCPNVLDGAATTATVKKAASGTALSAGTALHSGTIDLNTGANTNQALTLSTTDLDLDFAAGDKIGHDFSGALTNGVGATGVLVAM